MTRNSRRAPDGVIQQCFARKTRSAHASLASVLGPGSILVAAVPVATSPPLLSSLIKCTSERYRGASPMPSPRLECGRTVDFRGIPSANGYSRWRFAGGSMGSHVVNSGTGLPQRR
jgi:hypothetical protein